jgi:hypothetical protein
VCRYRCNTVEGTWLATATRCMVVKGKLSGKEARKWNEGEQLALCFQTTKIQSLKL